MAATRYIRFLAFVLLGYALAGRGFAYVGVPPLFIGEIALLIGLYFMIQSPGLKAFLNHWRVWFLLAFMAWCAARTIPYIGTYGLDSVRDAMVWGYATFALIAACLIIALPQRLPMLERMYRRYILIFLCLSPLTWFLTQKADEGWLPKWPWADVPIVYLKGGDQIVQLTGAFAYTALAAPGWVSALAFVLVPLNLVPNISGRAALVAFSAGVAIVVLLRPRSRLPWIVAAMVVAGAFALWATDVHVRTSDDARREISFDQFADNLTSIVNDSDNEELDGSKQWRLRWWNDIVGYTFHGRYFWTGKGFGINLALDDNYQVTEAADLRSPHNGHMTILARTGVPGLVLWSLVHLVWAASVIRAYIQATRRRDKRWANFFIFLFVYWLAFLINATFDVFLEGPMGGIWFWTIYGVGLGSVRIFEICPRVLHDADAEEKLQAARHANSARPQLLSTAGRRRPGLPRGSSAA